MSSRRSPYSVRGCRHPSGSRSAPYRPGCRPGIASHVKNRSALALVLVLVPLAASAVGLALGNGAWAQEPVSVTPPDRADAAQECSLHGYVALLDALQASDTSEVARKVHADDKALVLTRLADLAERRGSSAESTRLTAEALAVCSTAGLSYCSSVELRQRAQKLDLIFNKVKQSN